MTTKKPQDHKPTDVKDAAEKQKRFEEIEGHELLIPFSELRKSDGVRILARLRKAMNTDDVDASDVDTDDIDLEAAADFIDFIEDRYIADPEGWAAFGGAQDFEKVMELCFSYAGELGKGKA